MLTADLVRVVVRKGEIRPSWIDTSKPQWVERAEELCALFERAQDVRRVELEEAMDDLVGDETGHLVTRGFAKLLDDRCTWETGAAIEPVDLRKLVFEAAFRQHPIASVPTEGRVDRAQVLQQVASELSMTVEALERALYGDLRDEQRLVEYKPMAPRDLLDRYNLALAQGVLLRARELRVRVAVDRPQRLRQLYRWLKFHQLMHRSQRVSPSLWDIVIDGPLSLFAQSQRYGLLMAQFLPAIALLDQWSLEADVEWPHHDGPLLFRLSSEDGLRSHLSDRGTWLSPEDKVLFDRINADTEWIATRDAEVMDLGGQDVLVPDLVLTHRTTGRRAFVEIVGFWRAAWLERRAEALRKYGPPGLIVCVSRRLATGEKGDRIDPTWIDYAEVIPLARVLARAQETAVLPSGPPNASTDTPGRPGRTRTARAGGRRDPARGE
jgi:predicted nuclease of restriction endonuclease-like RecB superfamily